MKAVTLHEKTEIEQFLRRHTYLHLYPLGDLDDFFWPYTTWYALKNTQGIQQLVLLYGGLDLPILLGIVEDDNVALDNMRSLLQAIIPLLPRRFYALLSRDVAIVFANGYQTVPHGKHYKMALLHQENLKTTDISTVVTLTPSDLPALQSLYRIGYPGNWFDAHLLQTGCYFGIWRGSNLVSAAGVHVYSARYKIAVLGNVATHPDARGHGLATAVCAKLCAWLSPTTEHIGLNVKADNTSAIACYQKPGFERLAEYHEYMFEPK